jgi:hypothetical protein
MVRGGPGRRCVVLMIQSSWDDTLLGVRPSPGPGRGAVSSQSSRDKRPKRSLPGSTVRREGRAIGALAPLVGEVLGVERAAIEVNDDGLRHSVRVGDTIDFDVEDIVPFGVETGEPVRFQGMFHPVGSDLTMAEARQTRINAFGISYEGKTGLSKSTFSWAA